MKLGWNPVTPTYPSLNLSLQMMDVKSFILILFSSRDYIKEIRVMPWLCQIHTIGLVLIHFLESGHSDSSSDSNRVSANCFQLSQLGWTGFVLIKFLQEIRVMPWLWQIPTIGLVLILFSWKNHITEIQVSTLLSRALARTPHERHFDGSLPFLIGKKWQFWTHFIQF